jgi:hypothetical protein
MQSIQPGSQRTPTDDANTVTVVAAPAAGFTRTVVALRFTNLDSGPVTAILKKVIGATAVEVERKTGLAANGVWKDAVTLQSRLVLQDETESLTVELAGAVAAAQPQVLAEYFDGEND